ncbi:MAG TPA: hypothetical protein VH561_17395 [Micromonosporaceae bacterium]|jgi:hypothetical protein
MARPLYVETVICADAGEIWRRTQDPECHERWDLRFTHIDYAPPDRGRTRFRYATRVLPGVVIVGTGITVGERARSDGTRTSALRFASDDRRSLIRAGAGYWRYVPTGAGVRVRFVTGYDYRPGWGAWGVLADRAFRPMLGWATAWSFDRLRLWLERGISPRRALAHGLAEVVLRCAAAAAAAAVAPWWLAAAVVLAAVGLPPGPTTPAARRCLRRAPDRLAVRAPSTLEDLEAP